MNLKKSNAGIKEATVRDVKRMDAICKRCGKCCHLVDSITKRPGIKTCRFLIKTKDGRTLCRIYNNRLGKKLDDINTCHDREDISFDFENCPLNNGRELVLDVELGL